MRTIAAAAFLLIASGVSAAAPAPAPQLSFRVGGVDLQAPMPEGFCLPTGREIDAAQLLAAGDEQSVTHLTLLRCRAPGAPEGATLGDDYILVKTPKQALVVEISRDKLLEGMGEAFANPAVAELVASGRINDDAERSLGKVLGDRIDLSGTIAPVGKDDMCAYLGGTIAVSGSQGSYKVSLGACITAIGGRVLAIYWYGPDQGPPGIARLLIKSKTFARTIAARPPR